MFQNALIDRIEKKEKVNYRQTVLGTIQVLTADTLNITVFLIIFQ